MNAKKKICYLICMILAVAFVAMNISKPMSTKADTTDPSDVTATTGEETTESTESTEDTEEPWEDTEWTEEPEIPDYTIDSQGRYVITDNAEFESDTYHYTRLLRSLLEDDEKRTIVIPSGSKITLVYTLHPGSNKTIIATGATITQTGSASTGSSCGIMSNVPTKMNYQAATNITITGGTWTQKSTTGTASLFRFAHANNIKFNGKAVIKQPYKGHGIEFIACKNCSVSNCSVTGVGKTKANSVEEAIQIDIAEIHTAPGLKNECGASYCNGATCQNITIDKCTIRGGRGICANYAAKGTSSMKNKFHGYLKITNCTIEGMTAEAVALFNTTSATITGNKMRSKNTSKTKCYSVGLNITLIGKNSAVSKGTINIQKNKIAGYRNGVQVISTLSKKDQKNNKYRYKSVTIKSNKIYAKAGSKKAINVSATKKKSISKNSTKKWTW